MGRSKFLRETAIFTIRGIAQEGLAQGSSWFQMRAHYISSDDLTSLQSWLLVIAVVKST